jgi:membrane protein YfhO
MTWRSQVAGAARPSSWFPVLALLAVALAYATLVVFHPQGPGGAQLSADAYWADYPNVIYALRALREGHGLLWNRLQNCGQPFLASTLVGLYYPPHALAAVLGPERGMFAIAVLHFTIAGIGTYALCRELGLRRGAALCGAVVFEIGGAAIHLGTWLPYSLLGVYAWMPVAVWRTERLLRVPTVGNGIVLGLVLTLQLLIGYPQLLVFTYQVVALRALWECRRRDVPRLRILGVVLLGAILPAALGAAQLLPMLEFAGESARNRSLTNRELTVGTVLDWKTYLSWRSFSGLGTLFTVGPTLLAGMAVVRPDRWRLPLFYALLAAVYLAIGLDTPLAAVSRLLPFGRSFRWPQHALVVTALGYAVLIGFAADGLMGPPPTARRGWGLPLAGLLLGAGALVALLPAGPQGPEWWEAALFVAVIVWLASRAPLRAVPRVALPGMVLVAIAAAAGRPVFNLGSGPGLLYARSALFSDLQKRMTLQDRIYSVGQHVDYTLARKSASVFALPSIGDYEPQTSRRYAELFVMMLSGVPMLSVSQFEIPITGELPSNRQLLDLLAARYLVIDVEAVGAASSEELVQRIGPGVVLLEESDGVAVLQNSQAMPRAFFVPTTRMVDSPATMLARLARDPDVRGDVLIEEAAGAHDDGGDPRATGEVDIVADRSEEVVLQVRSTGPGYVFLSDQYYPGWEATVNGAPVPIRRGNFVFRVVAVPAGASTVVFRYRPSSVYWGLGVSAATLAVLGIYTAIGRRRRTR